MTATEVFEDIETYRYIARTDPVRYCRVCLGIDPWPKQREILRAAADPNIPYICWRSGNGVGKTYLTAAIICQYLDTHYPGLVAVSSASWNQLLKTVWPKLRMVVRNAPVNLGGDMQATEWKRDPDGEWGAFCVSPSTAEGFSGFRTASGVLVIVDEASALGQGVHEAIMGLTSAAGSKVIYLGNPLRPEGPFHACFSNPDWMHFHTAATEVIKYNISGLATEKWVETRKREWGEDHPIYKARVLGEFPESTSDTLIKLAWLKHMIIPGRPSQRHGPLYMGVDVARFGDDRTAFVIRDDRAVLHVSTYDKTATTEVAGHTNRLAKQWKIGEEHVYIDDSGVGGGVTDTLHGQGFYVTPVNVGEAALDRDNFRNLRAELYWAMRKVFDSASKKRLFIPEAYKALAMECTWPTYTLDERGRIQLEKKQMIKKRKGRSPDLSDALSLTFYEAGGGFGISAA